jgi:ribosomal protein S18 acetylase RimI-like enzyme
MDDDGPLLSIGALARRTGLPVRTILAGLRRQDHVIELRRMVIAGDRRGAGLGRRLLRAAVARAYGQHAARRVWLDVKDDNIRAQTLYRSEGFAIERTPAGAPVAVESGGRRFIVMVHDGPETARPAAGPPIRGRGR